MRTQDFILLHIFLFFRGFSLFLFFHLVFKQLPVILGIQLPRQTTPVLIFINRIWFIHCWMLTLFFKKSFVDTQRLVSTTRQNQLKDAMMTEKEMNLSRKSLKSKKFQIAKCLTTWRDKKGKLMATNLNEEQKLLQKQLDKQGEKRQSVILTIKRKSKGWLIRKEEKEKMKIKSYCRLEIDISSGNKWTDFSCWTVGHILL